MSGPDQGINVIRGNGRERRKVTFRFFPNGTSTTAMTKDAGTLIDPGDAVQDVTRSATAGVFTATLRKTYGQFLGGRVAVQLAANNVDLHGQIGQVSNLGVSNSTDPTSVIVRLMTATTATDMSSNTNNSVMVELDFEDLLLKDPAYAPYF